MDSRVESGQYGPVDLCTHIVREFETLDTQKLVKDLTQISQTQLGQCKIETRCQLYKKLKTAQAGYDSWSYWFTRIFGILTLEQKLQRAAHTAFEQVLSYETAHWDQDIEEGLTDNPKKQVLDTLIDVADRLGPTWGYSGSPVYARIYQGSINSIARARLYVAASPDPDSTRDVLLSDFRNLRLCAKLIKDGAKYRTDWGGGGRGVENGNRRIAIILAQSPETIADVLPMVSLALQQFPGTKLDRQQVMKCLKAVEHNPKPNADAIAALVYILNKDNEHSALAREHLPQLIAAADKSGDPASLHSLLTLKTLTEKSNDSIQELFENCTIPKMAETLASCFAIREQERMFYAGTLPDMATIRIKDQDITLNPRRLALESQLMHELVFSTSEPDGNVRLRPDWRQRLKTLFESSEPESIREIVRLLSQQVDTETRHKASPTLPTLRNEIHRLGLRSIVLDNIDARGRYDESSRIILKPLAVYSVSPTPI